MTYNEKALIKLSENMICFADKLICDKVYEDINIIITAAKKNYNAKPEVKIMLDEFEAKVVACRKKGLGGSGEGDESELQKIVGTPPSRSPGRRSVSKQNSAAPPPASKKKQPAKAPPRRVKKPKSSDDDDSDGFVEPERLVSQQLTRSTRERKKRVLKLFEESDEED